MLAGASQTDQQAAVVLRIRAGLVHATRSQAVDHAFDGGDIHRRQATEQILRAWPGLVQLGQRRPLRRCQVDADLAREDGGMTLRDLAQDKTDLLVENIGRPRRLDGSFRRNIPCHLRPRSSAYSDRCASRMSGRASSSAIVPPKQILPRSMM